jgi:PAS domain S-box-containing protein
VAGEALRRSEARFRATFDQAAVGIAHVAPDGRLLRVNGKLCELLGYELGELQDRMFHDLAHHADSAVDATQIARLLSGEITGYCLEKRYVCRNGSLVWLNVTVSLVRTSTGDRYAGLLHRCTGGRAEAQAS